MSPSATVKPPPLKVTVPPRKLTRWDALFRLLTVILIAGSLAFSWWIYTRVLIPLQKQSRALSASLNQLSAEVDVLSRKWPKAERDQIRADYQEVRNQLFADEAELGRWLVRLEEESGPLALEVKVDFGKGTARTAEEEKLAIIPASITLEVRPTVGGTQTPYQRMLRLGQMLAAEGKRADLAELDVNGGPLSITHGLLVFNLWAGESK
jgi:hypothetical protein